MQSAGAQLLAISSDDRKRLARFKAELEAPFPFIPDPEARLIELFDLKMPVLALAKRTTIVIGRDRKVLKIDSGDDAIDPSTALGAAASCQ